MKKLALGTPPGDPKQFQKWAAQALMTVQLASFEDAELIFDDFQIVGAFTETRSLTPGTATTTDIANFLATLVSDLKRRGQKRNYDEV